MKQEKIVLTGDRPTGKLHIGHYVCTIFCTADRYFTS